MHRFGVCLSWLLVIAILHLAAEATDIAAAEPTTEQNPLSEQEIAEGWLLLFDGQSLFGWQQNDQSKCKLADGALLCQAAGPALCTTTAWADFVLKVQFRAQGACDGSLLLRYQPTAEATAAAQCCEIAIAENVQTHWPTGSLLGRRKAKVTQLGKDAAGWRDLEVCLEGPQLRVKLDGQEVLDSADLPVRRGQIGLLCREGQLAVRNIKLKPLGLKSIFNGKDFSGWKITEGSKSTFTVTPEGWLNVKSGRGSIETVGLYGDFVLQLDVKVNGKGLNSGVFFRSIPGQVMNGYECQIHNVYKGQDRTQPADCGTGGIFRRQNARKVVADDFRWFTMTIHADGKHIATWVNGYQTADWTDDRPAHENPRNGCRVEPGTIQFQGHDPTTDLDFRNIRIGQLPPK